MKTYYLPISLSTVETLLQAKSKVEVATWFEGATKLDVASVLILLQVPVWVSQGKMDIASKWAARFFYDLDEGTSDLASLKALKDFAKKAFKSETLNTALDQSDLSGVFLTPETQMRTVKPAYMNALGGLRSGYSAAIAGKESGTAYHTADPAMERMGLTEPQGRAMSKLLSEPDESMALQGYAGTGKGVLIGWITSANKNRKKLILALTYNQLSSIMSKVSDPKVKGKTFGQLARDLIGAASVSPDLTNRSELTYNVTDTRIAERFAWASVGNLQRATVAKIVRGTISKFCLTTDNYLAESHLPALADRLSLTDRKVLVIYAERYWSELFDPDPGEGFLPVRGYHMIKYAALRGLVVSGEFDQVIVEEAHDLSGPMSQILDRANLSVITLGDKFQRFEGFVPVSSRAVRTSILDVSMRSGKAIEAVLNPLISAHPFAQDEPPLRANTEIQTQCVFYERPELPDAPCTLLVGSNWHMLQWFQLLVASGAKFALLPGSAKKFTAFVQGIIGLYHEGKRPMAPELFRYPTWDALSQDKQAMKAFGRVEHLLKRGYSYADFNAGLNKMVAAQNASYLLGQADDSKNMEFDRVMLTPEMFSKVTNRAWLQTSLSRIYVASSRARNQLIVPGYMRDWVADVKRVKSSND